MPAETSRSPWTRAAGHAGESACVAVALAPLGDGSPVMGDVSGLGPEHEFQMSSICAANATLHRQLVRAVDAGVTRLKAELG